MSRQELRHSGVNTRSIPLVVVEDDDTARRKPVRDELQRFPHRLIDVHIQMAECDIPQLYVLGAGGEIAFYHRHRLVSVGEQLPNAGHTGICKVTVREQPITIAYLLEAAIFKGIETVERTIGPSVTDVQRTTPSIGAHFYAAPLPGSLR